MIVREPWWVFPKYFDRATCDRIIAHGLGLERVEGQVRTGHTETVRKTAVSWIDEDWVYDLVMPPVEKANVAAGWKFDIQRTQVLQFGVYAEGGHYAWHHDDRSGRLYSAADNVTPAFHGMLRKISFSLLLNDGADYDGGDLEFELGLPSEPERVERPEPERRCGTVIVFPSFVPHRVTPVTRGVRYSLVGWSCGPPWR